MESASLSLEPTPGTLELHRRELTAYCYRMLGSPTEAEDAVQDTLLRAWRSADGFQGRSAVRTWLYRIATNVCLDRVNGAERRIRPMDVGPAGSPEGPVGETRPEAPWLEPLPADPAEVAESRETIRLAFVAALQHLPPRQRATLILCEVLRFKAVEAAGLLDTSVASVNSALQRARATLEALDVDPAATSTDALTASDRELLDRYVVAFERYDMEALTTLIREDATQSMPPYELWLRGRADILAFWLGPGHACRGSRVIPTRAANGSPAFGQYKASPDGDGYTPWALQVLELAGGRIGEFTFFLDTDRVFGLFGLPAGLDADGRPVAAG